MKLPGTEKLSLKNWMNPSKWIQPFLAPQYLEMAKYALFWIHLPSSTYLIFPQMPKPPNFRYFWGFGGLGEGPRNLSQILGAPKHPPNDTQKQKHGFADKIFLDVAATWTLLEMLVRNLEFQLSWICAWAK